VWALGLLVLLAGGCSPAGPVRPGEQRSGLFLIRKDGRWGYVGSSGKVEIAPQFEQAGPFSDGLAVVAMGGRAGYIDKTGKFAINPQFDSGTPFSEGLAAVRVGSAWGFINKSGRLVIPTQFQDPGPGPMQFSEGLAAVESGPCEGLGWGVTAGTGNRPVRAPRRTLLGVYDGGWRGPACGSARPFSDGVGGGPKWGHTKGSVGGSTTGLATARCGAW